MAQTPLAKDLDRLTAEESAKLALESAADESTIRELEAVIERLRAASDKS